MSKEKLTLCVVLSLCFLALLVWGSIEFQNSGQSKNPNLIVNENHSETSESSLASPSSERPAALQSIKSCSIAMEILPSPRSTKQWIYPHGNGTTQKVEVLCDFQVDGGGWTVIQKRASGPRQEFNKNWSEYSNGFGSLDRNFWIGLENIYALTKDGDQELRIQLEDFEGEKTWAKYSSFSISDASDFYRLSLSGYSGNASDSMTTPEFGSSNMLNGMKFSTKDKDNDLGTWGSCLNTYGGGWWFNSCGFSNLNGPYRHKEEEYGILWWSRKRSFNSLAKTEMKIRTRRSE